MRSLMELVARMSYTLIQGTLEREVSAVVYDSRKAEPNCVFVCIAGAVSDGHDFLDDVVAKGAAAVVTQRPVSVPQDVTVLRAPSTRTALAELAAAWFHHPAEELVTIGITGTKGKTTTAYMIREILERSGQKTGLIGTIEVLIGEERYPAVNTTPESFLVQEYFRAMVDAGIRCVVMEVSSQALKLERVAGFVFDYGVFTNLEEDHIGGAEHPDMADYIRCKGLLFRRCRIGICNADADYLEEVLDRHTCRVETFGRHESADLWASDVRRIQRPGYLGLEYTLNGLEQGRVRVDIPGDFTVDNSLAAIAVCRHLGVDRESILSALDRVQVRGRLEVVPVPGEYTLMIDYAHNAMSLEALLTNIRGYAAGRVICLFGCGGNRAKGRRYEMGEVSSRLADLTVVTSDNPRWEEPTDIIRDILEGVRQADGAYITVPDRKEAIRRCMELARPGDIVLLCGKGHEDYQEIRGQKHHMDERELIAQILEEERKSPAPCA